MGGTVMAAAQTQFEIEAPDTQQKFEIEPPAKKAQQPSFISQAGSALAGYYGIDATPEDVSSAGRKLGSDLWNMAKGAFALPSRDPNAKGDPISDLALRPKQFVEDVKQNNRDVGQHYEEQKQAGYSLPYRVISPIAEHGLGVNVRGMEESAREGDRGGVIGHAAAVPAAMAITEGVTRGAPAAIDALPKGAIRKTVTAPVRYGARAAETAINQKLMPAKPLLRIMTPADEAAAVHVKVPGRDFGLATPKPPAPAPAIEPPAPAPKSNPDAIVYRARDVGEQGVPYRPESHAQATRSLEQARSYANPEARGAVRGAPQEAVGIDLSQAPGFSVTRNNPNWIKFHGEVPETAISKAPEAPAISTQERVNAIGNQVEQGLGGKALEPNVPLREQMPAKGKASMQTQLPEGFTPAESSSWVKGTKYNPEANELEFMTSHGTHHVLGDVTPEQFAEFQKSKSVGQGINKLKASGSPDVAKYVNGKRVSVKPVQR